MVVYGVVYSVYWVDVLGLEVVKIKYEYLVGAVEECGGGGEGHQGIHIVLMVFDFLECVDVEITAAEKDYGQ
jgi:hypothetical protein